MEDNSTAPKILVVEDEKLLLNAIGKKLTNSGYAPILCQSAQKALDYLASTKTLPNAIWLDYYLGDMNGVDFMNELRKNDGWSSIPLIVVSNSASEQKRQAMLSMGAKKYLLKAQYRLEDIVKELAEMIGV